MKSKKYLWGILYGFLLTAFTIYVLLDTFVIARVYSTAPSENSNPGNSDTADYSDSDDAGMEDSSDSALPPSSASKDTTSAEDDLEQTPQTVTVTDTSYIDANISITLTEYHEYDTTIYVADVQLSSAEYLKTALAQGAYGKNVTEKTSKMAQKNDAILAINGDYYGVQEKGYVLRNGVLYRSSISKKQEDLVIYNDGSFSIITEGDVSADELLADGAQQILSFGPALIMNKTISVTKDEEVAKAMTSNPRTAIGMVSDLHYLFVVSDGRTSESEGLTLFELAEFMQSLGAVTAYNLDGGGSSTMYFNGEIINKPTTSGRSIKERSVSDIVYIGY